MGTSEAPESYDAQAQDAPSTAVAPSSTKEIAPASAYNTDDPAASANQSAQEATSSKEPSATPMTAVQDTNGVTPYGTRSRNRGGVRPNYADDKDIDLDNDFPDVHAGSKSKKRSESRETVSSSAPDDDSTASTNVGHLKKSKNGHQPHARNSSTGYANSAKDPIPGTSTWSVVNGNDVVRPVSKKRKAPGGLPSANAQTSTAAAANQPGSKSGVSSAKHSTGKRRDRSADGKVSNIFTFDQSHAQLKGGRMVADDGTVFEINDHVYLVCEPPGDPYYICRVMEFQRAEPENSASVVESMRVNWYYRPRDVQRFAADTRQLFATMHSDICPLTSLRGKCTVKHRSEIEDLDEYRKAKDSFWFNQVHDRFIHRYYDVIPTANVVNVPEKVKKALDEWWKYVVVETTRVKELTSAVKSCKRCAGYCATDNSVECAVCHNTYHMDCVRPPLLKKPSRGFAWACGPCSRAQERRLEARHIHVVGAADPEEEDVIDEEEEEPSALVETTAPTPNSTTVDDRVDGQVGLQAEIALAKMWPMRYLGIHCRVEDALQRDDRAIYPRASSRLGPRHQANVTMWPGRPVEFVKRRDVKRRFIKTSNHKKDAKFSKETIAELEADRVERAIRPKWVQDEPYGYVARGEDLPNDDPKTTARLLFKMPDTSARSPSGGVEGNLMADNPESMVDDYMARASGLAKDLGLTEYSTNYLDKALELLQRNRYDADAALQQLKNVDKRKDLREPHLNREECKRFDEGVSLYGSDLRLVRQHVKSASHATIVRYYYLWKKTDKGRQIWGHFEGRRGAKRRLEASTTGKELDNVADDHDDSAFDAEKAEHRNVGFQCKFCSTRHSRQWRRAPNTAPGIAVALDGKGSGKAGSLVVALCQRCAALWRKYAIKCENMDEVAKKVAQGGGKAMKRRIDEELLSELIAANEGSGAMVAGTAAAIGAPVAVAAGSEPPKKKLKGTQEKESTPGAVETITKKKIAPAPPPKLPTPPPVPDPPEFATLDCEICFRKVEKEDPQYLCCKDCRLTVHRQCYGVEEQRSSSRWVCDGCVNEKSPQVSLNFECVLCAVRFRHHELLKPPKKPHHKKKSEYEREKEKLDKDEREKFTNEWRQKQISKNRPVEPREALKRTEHNNWVHVTCAVWTPEVKFSNAGILQVAEGIGNIPTPRYNEVCKICRSTDGACVSCFQCHASFHVGCAHAAEYIFGFDIAPVKGSRRDVISTVTLGAETGSMTPAIWCRSHQDGIKTIVHPMFERVGDSAINALQLFVQTYKQADLTLTGTVRKASLINQNQSTKAIAQNAIQQPTTRRTSVIANGAAPSGGSRALRTTPNVSSVKDGDTEVEAHTVYNQNVSSMAERKCVTCKTDISPKWYEIEIAAPSETSANHDQLEQGRRQSKSNLRELLSKPEPDRSTGLGLLLNGENDGTAPSQTDATRQLERMDAPTLQHVYQCHKCHQRKLRPSSNETASKPALPMSRLGPLRNSPPPPLPPGWPAQQLPPLDHVQGWSRAESNGYENSHQASAAMPPQNLQTFTSPPPRQMNGYGPSHVAVTSPYFSRQAPPGPAQALSYGPALAPKPLPSPSQLPFDSQIDRMGPPLERRLDHPFAASAPAQQHQASAQQPRPLARDRVSPSMHPASMQQPRPYTYPEPPNYRDSGIGARPTAQRRPTTPTYGERETVDHRGPTAGGASASPNLANLLH